MLKRSAILGLSLAAASLRPVPWPSQLQLAPPHASTSTVTTTAREATAAPANCPAGDLCGYTSPNYVGSVAAGTEGERLAGNNLNLNVAMMLMEQGSFHIQSWPHRQCPGISRGKLLQQYRMPL